MVAKLPLERDYPSSADDVEPLCYGNTDAHPDTHNPDNLPSCGNLHNHPCTDPHTLLAEANPV